MSTAQNDLFKKVDTKKKNVGRPKAEEKKGFKRIYKGEAEIDHDLFKLEVANLKKNISIDDERPIYVGVEHCHFYHTYDSNGKIQETCNPIAGHSHKITMKENADGELEITCGPPIVKSGGKYQQMKNDNHTHDIRYLRSERMKVRRINEQATMFIDNFNTSLQS